MKSVYIASAGPERHKIGISRNPVARLRDLSGASGYRLVLVEARELPGAAAVERLAHWILRASRLHGEWFAVGTDQARAALAEAVARAEAGEGVRSRPPAKAGPPPQARWYKWLTDEERAQVAELDAVRKRPMWMRIERQMIANRALQRARYAERTKG